MIRGKFLLDEVACRLIDFSAKNRLPAGNLDFRVGAICEISSSTKIFGIVTEILLNILITVDKEKLLDNIYSDNLFLEHILNSRIFTEK